MQQRIPQLVVGIVALTCASLASARVSVSIGLNPYGYGAYAPPVVYQPTPYYYGAPPVVYYGGGNWGDGHGRRPRGRDDHRDNRNRPHDRDHGH